MLTVLSLSLAAAGVSASGDIKDLTADDIQRLGEKMYRQGVLPSGQAMKAFVSGDVPVEGTSFTCVSCHLRSGLGSIEGEVITTPTNGRILYQPREPFIPGAEFVPLIANYAKNLPTRPAYTDETLAAMILTGTDPTGRSLLKVMPRYELNDREMAIMIAYLKTLSDQPPPGVTADGIRFATVIVEGADPKEVEAMLTPIQFSIDRKNSLALAASKNFRVARMGYNMLGNLSAYRFTFSKWYLKGSPETWRAQLEEYYRKEPVFALLGGISPGDWEPVHRFCEDHKLPNLFPVVEYPVISDTDWYTLYFSRGVRQEGEAAARYLNGMSGLLKDKSIVQISGSSRRTTALATGFREVWQAAGHPAPVEVALAQGEQLTRARLDKVIKEHKPAVLLVWDDESALAAVAPLADDPARPGLVIMSGTTVGTGLWTVAESAREMLYFTYPYRLPQEDVRFDVSVKKVIPGKSLKNYDHKTLRQSFITGEVLGKALMEMRGEYHRDYLYDAIGMMTDMYYPLYERVSFGPGQRYASKGCYVVQVGKGATPRLERRSEWVIP
jgi:hypothetical protein